MRKLFYIISNTLLSLCNKTKNYETKNNHLFINLTGYCRLHSRQYMQVDNNLCSNEPTAMSIQLEIEQKKWQPKAEPVPVIKRAKTSYNQDVCSSVLEVYNHNLLNPIN